jgi:23S rRNA pseudouridine2605 synthase
LNKYIANSGVCNRREADALILKGEVAVNGKVVKEHGIKVVPGSDIVTLHGERLYGRLFSYVLLNKPKNCISAVLDPQGRITVFDLVANASESPINPVDSLERNTLGLLLLTDDVELAKRLIGGAAETEELYHVVLESELSSKHLEEISERADVIEIRYVDDKPGPDIGIRVKAGNNKEVRRMFEQLGYPVVRLDRVVFAGLTKRDLPRGRWRHLSPKEVSFLKMSGR